MDVPITIAIAMACLISLMAFEIKGRKWYFVVMNVLITALLLGVFLKRTAFAPYDPTTGIVYRARVACKEHDGVRSFTDRSSIVVCKDGYVASL